MLNGIYTVTRGMISLGRESEVNANNLANANTVGFKGEQVVVQSFPEILMSRIDEAGQHVIGTKGMGARVVATVTEFRPGQMVKTENPLDLGIEGEGFFTVETPNGIAYTRSGHFSLNDLGQVVTEEGHLVLGQNGPLQTNGQSIAIGEDGLFKVQGMRDDRIQLVTFEDLNQLEKLGQNLFRAPQGVQPIAATGQILQGFVEGSNVNLIQGMTQMITATRMYEMSQKAIQSQDETLSKAVNEVGRVSG